MSEDKPAKFKVHINPDPKAVVRRGHSGHFALALSDVTANLLRISRGTGDTLRVCSEIIRLAKTFRDYCEALEESPSDREIREAIDSSKEFSAANKRPDHIERDSQFEAIIRASLQIAASRIKGQIPQQRTAENELRSAITTYSEANERIRKQMKTTTSVKEARTALGKLKKKK